MLTIQLYGLAENPKTQLLKVNLLDALVELPVAFSFVQISTLDAFLEQKLAEIPCLMVNGRLVPTEVTQSKEELSKLLHSLDVPLPPPTSLPNKRELPPHAGATAYPLRAKIQRPLPTARSNGNGQETSRSVNRPPTPPREDPDISPSSTPELPRRTG